MSKLEERGVDLFFKAFKALILPSPLILLAIIHSIEAFVIMHPYMIYILFFIPAFLFSICLYLLIKAKEKNSFLQEKVNDSLKFKPLYNAYWNIEGEPHCLTCKNSLVHSEYAITESFSSEIFECFKCNKSIYLRDKHNNIIKYSDAKSAAIKELFG